MTELPDLFNPSHPEFTRQRFSLLARLRDEAPVAFLPALGCWAVTRHEDVLFVLSNPTLFASSGAYSSANTLSSEARDIYDEHGPLYRFSLVNMDRPDHARLRTPIAAAFVPRRIRELEADIREDARQLLTHLFDASEVADLITEFAKPLPIRTICRLIGLPLADIPRLQAYSDAFVALLVPSLPVEAQRQAVTQLRNFDAYMRSFVTGASTGLTEGLLGNLLTARARGEHDLTDDELVGSMANVVFAGHETTVNTLGNAFVRLLADLDLWTSLATGQGDVDTLVEELLRLDTSGIGLYRRATEETRVGHTTVPKGAMLWIVFGSANRDARVFAHPDELDLARANAKEHLTFGYGLHYCIGAALARAQMRAAVTLAPQLYPNLRQIGSAPELPHHALRATLGLPVSATVPSSAQPHLF